MLSQFILFTLSTFGFSLAECLSASSYSRFRRLALASRCLRSSSTCRRARCKLARCCFSDMLEVVFDAASACLCPRCAAFLRSLASSSGTNFRGRPRFKAARLGRRFIFAFSTCGNVKSVISKLQQFLPGNLTSLGTRECLQIYLSRETTTRYITNTHVATIAVYFCLPNATITILGATSDHSKH